MKKIFILIFATLLLQTSTIYIVEAACPAGQFACGAAQDVTAKSCACAITEMPGLLLNEIGIPVVAGECCTTRSFLAYCENTKQYSNGCSCQDACSNKVGQWCKCKGKQMTGICKSIIGVAGASIVCEW